jgi:CheY-like chemotaxis protein
MGALKQGNIQHRLTLVRDGDEALMFLRQEHHFARAPRPDLILLDLMLPKKSGIEVLSAIREHYDLRRIPVVILTASDADDDKLNCEMLDVQHYIKKPVNLEKFLTVVRQLKKYLLAEDVILPALD